MPTTAVIIAGTIASAVGSGVSAYGSYQQGKAQRRMAERNAKIAESRAAAAARDGRIMSNASRRQSERLKSRQRALYAKSGVTSAGSPLIIQAEQAAQAEMQALDIERNAENQAQAQRQQAELDRMQGKSAYRAGLYGAGSTLLQGAGDVATGIAAYNEAKK